MTPLARSWLRRIALGLPMVAVPLASPLLLGVSVCGPCGDSTETHSFAITEAQAARLLDDNGQVVTTECRAVCTELVDAIEGASDGSVIADAAAPDAGIGRLPASATASSCEVVSVDAMLEARCHWTVHNGCIGGRRPTGLTDHALRAPSAGEWLARMAWMEAASVDAFEELANELASFGAPVAIVRDARAAADDERRHATAIGALARARGVVPPPPERTMRTPRSLPEIALDNAVEGGVRETFGALLASHQAAYATDLDVRRAMQDIARDEARHAMLSDRIDSWARAHVDGTTLDRARAEAARALASSLEAECDDEARRALGLPSLDMQRALLRALA